MDSAKRIRAVGKLFAREELTEDELRNKLEEVYAANPTHLPQHGMAFKAGLQDGNCDSERRDVAWRIIGNIDSDYLDFTSFPGY